MKNKSKNLLYFTQVNLNKCKQGQIEIAKTIRKYNKAQKKFIVLIREPMNAQNRAIYQPTSCQIFTKSSNSRAAIYIDSNTKVWYMEALSHKDITVVQTRIENRSTLIISAYFDILNKDVIWPELETVMEYVEQKGLGVILGADTNAHSTSYGSTNNARGDLMDLFITRYKLDIENRGDTPTYESKGAKTHIDVTLTSVTIIL